MCPYTAPSLLPIWLCVEGHNTIDRTAPRPGINPDAGLLLFLTCFYILDNVARLTLEQFTYYFYV